MQLTLHALCLCADAVVRRPLLSPISINCSAPHLPLAQKQVFQNFQLSVPVEHNEFLIAPILIRARLENYPLLSSCVHK